MKGAARAKISIIFVLSLSIWS